ncbi:MAG: hypothetical protein F7C35_08285 [Desulfurococcales archaeon]|nr:hypothetical protein [Desulfurococcales archaeon]
MIIEKYWITMAHVDLVYDEENNVYELVFTGWKDIVDDEKDEPVRKIIVMMSDNPIEILEFIEKIERKVIQLMRER